MKDLISIIVPIYNVEKYIGPCLDSIINQTYKNIEIILINDGSKDNSLEIIKQYQEKDNRIVIVDRENKGVLYTRVEGFKIANGKYITYIDSDDWVEENMLEIMYNKAIEYDADVVKCDFGINDFKIETGINKSDVFITEESFEPDFYDKFLVDFNIHNVWAQLFKRDLLINDIVNVDTSIGLGDDLEINIQLFKNIKSILFMPNKLYHYRHNNLSLTRTFTPENINKNIVSATKAYNNAYKLIDEINIKDKVKYKQAVITRMINEIHNWQIDLIQAFASKEKSIEYLRWYYYEFEEMKKIQNNIKDIGLNTNNFKYKIFYKKVYTNLNQAYFIADTIGKMKKVYRKIKSKYLSK